MLTAITGNAQSVTLSAVGSLPVGDFAEDEIEDELDEDEAGLAKFGGGLDATLDIPVGSGVNLLVGAMFLVNPFDTDELEDYMDPPENHDYDLKTKPYMNIPITMGIQFAPGISEIAKVYLQGTAGLNLLMGGFGGFNSKESWTAHDYYGPYEVEDTYEFDMEMGTSFAFTFGSGFIIRDHLNIGFKYLNLGTVEFNGDMKYTRRIDGGITHESSDDVEDFERKVSLFTFQFGYRF